MGAGWLVEQHTLRSTKRLDARTNLAVALKDCMVAAAVVSSVIAAWARHAAKTSEPAGAMGRIARLARTLNRAFALGAIACTPLVNFRLLGGYRPSTFYRLFG
jgi:hypothetical protein